MKKKRTPSPRSPRAMEIKAAKREQVQRRVDKATEPKEPRRLERKRVAGRDPVSKKKTEQILDGSKKGSIFAPKTSKSLDHTAFAALKRADPKLYYEHFVGNRIDQELFRSAIARDDHYDAIMGCVDALEKVEKYIDGRKDRLSKDQASACALRINSIKSRITVHFKMLDKLLPDAVAQLSMSDTPEVLAMKLRKALNAMQEVDTDQVIDA